MLPRNGKPHFNTARGEAALTQQGIPPARYSNVSFRLFPLKVNMARLSAFCNAYFNIAPDILRVRPAMPFVFLAVVDYGKIASEYRNLGWVSQHEILFEIPLEQYVREGDQWIFRDWVWGTPFIFVDDDMSLTTGREVYGWPKVRAWVVPEMNTWVSSPRTPQRLLTLSSMVFPEVYTGETQQPGVLLEIEHAAPPTVTQLPPDLSSASSLLWSIPQALSGGLSAVGDVLEVLTSLPILGYEGSGSRHSLQNMLVQLFHRLNVVSSAPALRQITLKQFRDAEQPQQVCYQALVQSDIQVSRFNGGGLLSEVDLLRGDLTGGFQIKIHRYDTQPIIESLGLEVAHETTIGREKVATLSPLLPIWLDLDLTYGTGESLCWRTKHNAWSTSSALGPPDPEPKYYNTARGAATQAIAGPYHFPNATVRVLPLRADNERLREFCADYLNTTCYRFEPYGPYVFMLATSLGEMSSETNAIGLWLAREVAFYIPVTWYRTPPGGHEELVGPAAVAPFIFADNSTVAITSREVTGRPTVKSQLESPRDPWMAEAGPEASRCLLTLKTEVLPTLYLGQEAQQRVLLEIFQDDGEASDMQEGFTVSVEEQGGDALVHDQKDHKMEVERMQEGMHGLAEIRKLALDMLVQREPFNEVSLKQFRDVEDPNAACFQALILSQTVIDELNTIQEIEAPLRVALHGYPSQPIARILGLQATEARLRDGVVVHQFQPVKPFWIRGTLKRELGETLCWRAGSRQWNEDEAVTRFFAERFERAVEPERLTALSMRTFLHSVRHRNGQSS